VGWKHKEAECLLCFKEFKTMIICGRRKFWQVLITNNGQAGRDFGGPWIWIMDHSATFAIEKETQSGQRRVFSMKCPR
jgi:hypothetical protein